MPHAFRHYPHVASIRRVREDHRQNRYACPNANRLCQVTCQESVGLRYLHRALRLGLCHRMFLPWPQDCTTCRQDRARTHAAPAGDKARQTLPPR